MYGKNIYETLCWKHYTVIIWNVKKTKTPKKRLSRTIIKKTLPDKRRHYPSFSVRLTGDSKPSITPTGPHLVVPLNAPFDLRCQGEKEIQWQREERSKVRGERRTEGASALHVDRALPVHMGRYVCLERTSGQQASIYVFVNGKCTFRCGKKKKTELIVGGVTTFTSQLYS